MEPTAQGMTNATDFCIPSSKTAPSQNILDLGRGQDFQLRKLSGSAAGIMSAVTMHVGSKTEDEVLQAVQRLVDQLIAVLRGREWHDTTKLRSKLANWSNELGEYHFLFMS